MLLIHGYGCVLFRQGGMGDTEYLAAFQQIVMPVAYEVCDFVSCMSVLYTNGITLYLPALSSQLTPIDSKNF